MSETLLSCLLAASPTLDASTRQLLTLLILYSIKSDMAGNHLLTNCTGIALTPQLDANKWCGDCVARFFTR